MTTVICAECQMEFQDRMEPHSCVPKTGPSFGTLGQSAEDFETARIRDLAQAPLAGEQLPAVPGVKSNQEIAAMDQGVKLALMIAPVMKELTRALSQEVDTLRQDIADSNRLLKHLDVPLEQVAGSHERAATSFENLRAEIAAVAARQSSMEKVIDTAGLTAAVGSAERRMRDLATSIETRFKETSENMVQVLTLLQKLQDRDLSHTRLRMKRAARHAVQKARTS